MPLRLVIGCYNSLVGEALKNLLARERDINIIGVFSADMDFQEFFELNPDVVLLSSKLFDTLPENFNPGTRLLYLNIIRSN